ncbi:unnamed protein product [Medioppia subpectinata]|uniref:Protein kinase domain-containing protein n=1 Tax=Medioppia subpectinata TaxID=1979941 RepID=A0A7R9Q3S9_9ACAR|nr:unnamed protein product [Medioppia subpectinata]CAG2111797.1 unnamed protein product [Medioppia subpectinata]
MLKLTTLTDENVAYFTYQLLRALKYIHSANVLHRDIKPDNILVNSNADLKVCDFGLARVTDPLKSGSQTVYVTTRWYRAPEVMLTESCYNNSMDVWSVGCVLGEMLSGRPLFPGQNHYLQVNCILDVLGSELDVSWITNNYIRASIISRQLMDQVNWPDKFPNVNLQTLNLLGGLLTFNPNCRISVDQALEHPYLKTYYDPNDLPVVQNPLTIFKKVDKDLSIEQLIQMIINHINEFNAMRESV